MSQSIQIQFCALIILGLVCYFSFKKHSIILESIWIYRHLLIVTLLCVIADITSILGITHCSPHIARLLCRVYLCTVIWTSFLSFHYVCYDIGMIRQRVRLRKMFALITLICSIVPFFLPIYYNNSDTEIYSY